MEKIDNKIFKTLITHTPNILKEEIRRQEIMNVKLPKECPDCQTKLIFDHSSFSSIDKHTQVWLSCNKCNINWYYCFDENMSLCDRLPWEH